MNRRLLVTFALGALLVGACTNTPAPAPTATATAAASGEPSAEPSGAPTGDRLAAIQSRGQLICGVNGALPGFSFLEQGTGAWSGFDVDYCKAVAAAVLGDPEAVEYRAAHRRTTADRRCRPARSTS